VANVSNHDDKAELVRRGFPTEKIVVLPFGMGPQRRRGFDEVSAEVPRRPLVVFVGTFDYRKGASDFPTIVRRILAGVPDARFRLVGTAGLMRTAEQVLTFFPADMRSAVEVRPTFAAEELPGLLADASVGVFPSYFEGFGFGVLEMLAAAVPVIAYDAPGPPMMLPRDWLVARGDARAMAAKVSALLGDTQQLAQARKRARELSRPFDWSRIAADTVAEYQARLNRIRSAQRS
jgi:glycosyltransferase involved in cell wall biosynthesis